MAARKKVPAEAKPVLGFIGQGFVGKSYADDFEKRRFKVVRYSLEEAYKGNKHKIAECDVVFIAVPTPSVPGKVGTRFDTSIVESSLRLAGEGSVAVIKSTLLPGTTVKLQKKFPQLTILFSPEFLNASTAAHDASHPFSNIVGMPLNDGRHRKAAALVHSILPKATYAATCKSEEAEIYKYAHNISGYMQVLTYNLMYDVARKLGVPWQNIEKALEADPMVSNWYIKPLHKSGRGAGGPCFIKDFAAFTTLYRNSIGKKEGIALLEAAERQNVKLLADSKKDLGLLRGVYGKAIALPPSKKSRR